MAQSNRVQTPRPESYSLRSRETGKQRPAGGVSRSTLDFERMPSYDLRALPTARMTNGHATAATTGGAEGDDVLPPPVELRLHAELIVHGSTDPQAELKLRGDRIPISRDGTFSHRFAPRWKTRHRRRCDDPERLPPADSRVGNRAEHERARTAMVRRNQRLVP